MGGQQGQILEWTMQSKEVSVQRWCIQSHWNAWWGVSPLLKLLTKSINARGTGDGTLNELDLLCFYCMQKGLKMDLRRLIAMHFHVMTTKKSGKLYGGIYVTWMMKHFRVRLRGFKRVKKMETLNMDTRKVCAWFGNTNGEASLYSTHSRGQNNPKHEASTSNQGRSQILTPMESSQEVPNKPSRIPQHLLPTKRKEPWAWPRS